MDSSLNQRLKKISIIVSVVAICFTAFFFENCAKSVDLSQYNSGASTGTSTGTGTTVTTTACNIPSVLTWVGKASGSTCSANTTGSTLAANGQLSYNATAPSVGLATFNCTGGNLVVDADTATCDLSCAEPATFTWAVGTTTCTAVGGVVLSNGQVASPTAQAPNTGAATFTCVNNAIQGPTNASCTPPVTPGCTQPPTFSWMVGGVTCTAPGGQTMADSATVQVTATSANAGKATFLCKNQAVTEVAGSTCVAAVAAPTITSILPATQTGCPGDNFTVTATATGTGLTYQWYVSATSGVAGTAVTGATAASFVGTYTSGTNYYYVIVKNSGGSATSGQVTVTARAVTAPLCGGGGGCFVAGTPVSMADGSQKSIEDIKAGDKVIAFNELTNSTYVTPVLSPLHHPAKIQTLHHFTLADGRTFTSNAVHPIFVVEQKKWVQAQDIYAMFLARLPTTLQNEDGSTAAITSITLEEKFTPVYNLEIEGLAPWDRRTGQFGAGHSYYVNGILVHNEKK